MVETLSSLPVPSLNLRSSATINGLESEHDGTGESILEFASGEDRSLKIKEIEQFIDTKTYVDVFQSSRPVMNPEPYTPTNPVLSASPSQL